jgi:hypothetical protein
VAGTVKKDELARASIHLELSVNNGVGEEYVVVRAGYGC